MDAINEKYQWLPADKYPVCLHSSRFPLVGAFFDVTAQPPAEFMVRDPVDLDDLARMNLKQSLKDYPMV